MKKKIILTTEQFIRLCEMDENNDTPLMDFFADNESEVPEVGGEAIEKIMDNGGKNLQVRVATNNDNLNDNVNISKICTLSAYEIFIERS